ncbi:MAG: tetratricopeptide repeat protein, partial [Myxococcota bacterium]
GRELGVRYVLEGSVRKAGNRIRVTAQLVDASNGHHIWAERYDRSLEDVFAVQDELTGEIVKALEVNLTEMERGQIAHIPTENLEAYDLFLRAQAIGASATRADILRARNLLEQAVELDPEFAAAYSELSATHMSEYLAQLTDDPGAMKRAIALAERAVRVDPSDPYARRQLCQVYAFTGKFDEAIAEAEKALALNPNDAEAYLALGIALSSSGDPAEALPPLRKASRLDPQNWMVEYQQGLSYVVMGRYRDAVPHLMRTRARNPNFIPSYVMLALAYVETGQEKRARAEVEEVKRINPAWSVEEIGNRVVIRPQERFEEMAAALKSIGLD